MIFSATGKVLATELPQIGNKTTILYPASAKASNEIGMGNVLVAYKKITFTILKFYFKITLVMVFW